MDAVHRGMASAGNRCPVCGEQMQVIFTSISCPACGTTPVKS
jgi:hypothetical protein